jgi:hypothetical protein
MKSLARAASVLALLAVQLGGCGGTPGDSITATGPGKPKPSQPLTPGKPVTTELSAKDAAELAKLEQELAAVAGLDAQGFAAKYAVPFNDSLGYSPLSAAGMDLIQKSALALPSADQSILEKRGFVISETRRFPSFIYGYQTLYLQDLPLYVSADSILYAVHQSYDALLLRVETYALIPALQRLLGAMRAELAFGAASALGQSARTDADLYLSVAASLLGDKPFEPVAGAAKAEVASLVAKANAAQGEQELVLFDAKRHLDFSQFEPRGHYTETEELKRYFRAMMWLGRIDFRILETQEDGSQLFRRRQLEGAYALRSLMSEASLADWKRIDGTIGAFVGEHDSMVVPELDSLLADLGLSSPGDLATASDATIAQAVVSGGYGTQRISSHIMINGLGSGTLPLSSSFLLFGQRYVLDSHVLSNVVYDRVQHGKQLRMMPSPLDAAFAAFGNDQAGLLLGSELEQWKYAPDLASMRVLADAHPAEYWQDNIYNSWLGMLRVLSPSSAVASPKSMGLPAVTGTEAWGRRLLSTQLSSWAELRHDTLLYAKQSYTGGASCEFPDAYVEPYPEFFAKLGAFATRGATLVSGLDLGPGSYLVTQAQAYFETVSMVAATLGKMAENQRSGVPHSAAQMAFINDAVVVDEGCGDPSFQSGWYKKLFFEPGRGIKLDPVIADVHTQPTDAGGAMVGKVLHVGTGMPRLMVVTVDTCSGPRAYAGLASSYFEHVTSNFDRLTDEEWSGLIQAQTPPDVAWMKDLVAR